MFNNIPDFITTYYLDTCVWGEIIRSEKLKEKFKNKFIGSNYLIALSQYTILEITRAKKFINPLDSLLYQLRCNVWMPSLYDQVIEMEIERYPNNYNLQWMPLSIITDEDNKNIMNKFAKDQIIINTREEYMKYSCESFMCLEVFKKNFPPKNRSIGYTQDEAELFAFGNSIEYLGRHFRSFLETFKHNISRYKPYKIKSLYIRSLVLFYKYYIHGQSPNKSDFLDFAHVSYSPYVDFYITEKNMANVLKRIKKENEILKNTEVVTISDFLNTLSE